MGKSNKKLRKKRNAKRRIKKVYISTVAIILATVTVVFCANYLMYKTDFFEITDITVQNSKVYSNEYIIKKSGINIGDQILKIDRKQIEQILENEAYVEKCKISYYLPDIVCINIKERQEKYLISYEDKTIITDMSGIVLDGNKQGNELFVIESYVEVKGELGKKIEFKNLDDFDKINELLNYSDSLDNIDKVQKLYIMDDNSITIDTKYETKIKMYLDNEIKYSYNFGLSIIKERLKNNEEVIGCLIDFTKGDSPVFSYSTKKEGE